MSDGETFVVGKKKFKVITILNRKTKGWSFMRDGKDIRENAKIEVYTDYRTMSLEQFKKKYAIYIY